MLRLTCSDPLLQDGVGNGNGQALAVQMSQFAYCMEQDCAQVCNCRRSTSTKHSPPLVLHLSCTCKCRCLVHLSCILLHFSSTCRPLALSWVCVALAVDERSGEHVPLHRRQPPLLLQLRTGPAFIHSPPLLLHLRIFYFSCTHSGVVCVEHLNVEELSVCLDHLY